MNDEEFLKLEFVSDEIFRISLCGHRNKSNNKWMTSINAQLMVCTKMNKAAFMFPENWRKLSKSN